MNLLNFINSESKRRMAAVVLTASSPLSVNDTARAAGVSRGLVSLYFHHLTNGNILRKVKGKYNLNDGPAVHLLRLAYNLSLLPTGKYFSRYRQVDSAGIYGSWVKGTNTAHSDVDLWIKTKTRDLGRTLALSGALKKRLGDVTILYLTPAKLKAMKARDPVFYYSLVFGSLILYGNGIEA